jgi:hypothetical protein
MIKPNDLAAITGPWIAEETTALAKTIDFHGHPWQIYNLKLIP